MKKNKNLLGNNQCLNVYCASNCSFKYDRKLFTNPNHVAAESIKLTAEYHSAYLDENINSNMFLMEENLLEIINKCKQLNNWDLLRHVIHNVFSNRQNLSSCFLKKGAFVLNLSSNQETSTTSSAIPKSKHERREEIKFFDLIRYS